MPASGRLYTGFVAKRGAKGKTKELPLSMRLSIARYLDQAMTENKWTTRAAEEHTEIDIATLSRARNAKGATGVHFLLKLRELVKQPIDVILGLPPIQEEAKPAPPPTIAPEGLMAPATAVAREWAERDAGVDLARVKKIPEHVIQAVLAEHQDRLFNDRKRRWWLSLFEEAYAAIRQDQRAFAVAASAKRVERAPKSMRGKRKKVG